MPINPEIALQIDFAAAAIAVIALFVSAWTWHHQSRMNLAALRLQRDNDIIQWTNAAIDTIVELEFLLRGVVNQADTKAFAGTRDNGLARLSASIDKGRLHFPNVDYETHGTEKEAAFRGFRQPILDRLVEAYDLVKDLKAENLPAIEAARDELMHKKREFVSEAQSAVDPRRRHAFIAS